MWMQMIHIALWFFKSLGRWKMCVAFEARHHAATKMVQVCKEETWNDMKLICTKTKAFLAFATFLPPWETQLYPCPLVDTKWPEKPGLQGFRKNIFPLGIAPFAAEKFQCETQSFSCNLLRWKKVTRELPTLHDRPLAMFVFNTCVLLYKMFAILWTNLKHKKP